MKLGEMRHQEQKLDILETLPLKSNFTHSRDRLQKIEIWETSLIVIHCKDVGLWLLIKSCLNTAHLHSGNFSGPPDGLGGFSVYLKNLLQKEGGRHFLKIK